LDKIGKIVLENSYFWQYLPNFEPSGNLACSPPTTLHQVVQTYRLPRDRPKTPLYDDVTFTLQFLHGNANDHLTNKSGFVLWWLTCVCTEFRVVWFFITVK